MLLTIDSSTGHPSQAKFPAVYSERTLKQLASILAFLKKGYRASFAIVTLRPYVKDVDIDTYTEFYNELVKCIDAGLIIKAYTGILQENGFIIGREIPVNY